MLAPIALEDYEQTPMPDAHDTTGYALIDSPPWLAVFVAHSIIKRPLMHDVWGAFEAGTRIRSWHLAVRRKP